MIRESTGTISDFVNQQRTTERALPNPLDYGRTGPQLLIGCGLALSAILLRIDHLTSVSFWFDEACAWRISGFPWPEMWDSIARDAHPPGFYLLERGWRGMWGNSVLAARSLGVCCGLAMVAAGWWCAYEIHQERDLLKGNVPAQGWFPLLAAVLLAWNALQIELSQEARPYELMACLSFMAGAFLLRALRRPRSISAWMGYLLAVVALSMTHYYGLLVAAALFTFAGLEILINWVTAKENGGTGSQHGVRQLGGLVLSLGFMQLCWLFWWETFTQQLMRANAQLWMPPLTWERVARLFWSLLAGGTVSPAWNEWMPLASILWLAVPLLLLREGRGGRLMAMCILLPIAASIGYSLVVRNILEIRYLVASQAYLFAGMACLLSRIVRSTPRRVAMIACLGWSLFWCLQQAEQRSAFSRFAGLRQACDYLNEQRLPDEPIIINSPFIDPTTRQLLHEPDLVRLQYAADPRLDLLGGPPLRPEDINVRDIVRSSPKQIWTLEAEGLFGRDLPVVLPESYVLRTEKDFTEHFGIHMNLVVRSYCRNTDRKLHDQVCLEKQGTL